MEFFDSLPKVNKLMVMREALLEDNKKIFAQMALRSVRNGHLSMHDLEHAFGRNADDPNHNPDACNPLK
jgi:hypothetical protein